MSGRLVLLDTERMEEVEICIIYQRTLGAPVASMDCTPEFDADAA
jgi:hypothetical protein